tara:strand:- start:1540 stop:1662 length:123 start_codon:yes stop_codon:yes gene_type:complete
MKESDCNITIKGNKYDAGVAGLGLLRLKKRKKKTLKGAVQ